MASQLDLIDPQKRLETFEKISSEGLLGVSKETIRGNEYYVFSESPDNLLGYYQLGLTHGEWTHVVFEDQQIPYSETLSRSYQLANSLQNIYGIKKGDTVSFSMRNYPEWMFAY
ncbi:MAG: AMP-binding protein, partial [Gammaproteobacteria bacterium]